MCIRCRTYVFNYNFVSEIQCQTVDRVLGDCVEKKNYKKILIRREIVSFFIENREPFWREFPDESSLQNDGVHQIHVHSHFNRVPNNNWVLIWHYNNYEIALLPVLHAPRVNDKRVNVALTSFNAIFSVDKRNGLNYTGFEINPVKYERKVRHLYPKIDSYEKRNNSPRPYAPENAFLNCGRVTVTVVTVASRLICVRIIFIVYAFRNNYKL